MTLSRHLSLSIFLLLFVVTRSVSAQEKPAFIRCNFSFGLGFPAYHQLGNHDIKAFDSEEMGKVKQGMFLMSLNAGIHILVFEQCVVSCLTEYAIGTTKWNNAFGSGDEVGMSPHIWDLDFEVRFLFRLTTQRSSGSAKNYIFPLVGAGPTLSYRLIDENGDGFVNGGGDWHYRLGVGIRRGGFIEYSLIALIRPSYTFKGFKVGGISSANFEGCSYSILLQTAILI